MNNFNQNWNNQTQNNQSATNSNSQTQPTNNQPSWLMQIAGAVLPTLLEQFTGQSLLTKGNNNPELQLTLTQAITLLQQIANSQQTLDQRLVRLETRASQQFAGLSHQIQNFKTVRLSSERERKQVEFNAQEQNKEY